MPKAAASPTLSATLRLPERSENSTIAAISSIRPATIRSHGRQPPPPTIARSGFIRPRRVEPALPLRLVGLPPQHRDAGAGQQQRPEGQALAGGQRDQQEYADRDRPDRDERAVVGEPALATTAALALAGRGVQARAPAERCAAAPA